MKDRQPTQVLDNGAIRYGIYNADGTLDHYEYMKREDEPTIEGTPLNKANLLSDATENKIWNNKEKPADPTVNDALYELAKGTARIGDIAMTARGDRSTAWLPCDGRAISNVEYPDLYNALRTDVDAGDWDEITVPDMLGTHPSISHTNGHWFIVAKSGDNSTLKVAVSDDLETFTITEISGISSPSTTVVGCSKVCYYDGKYAFAYYTTVGGTHKIHAIYATSPTGPWSASSGVSVNRLGAYTTWVPGEMLVYNGVYYITHPRYANIQPQNYIYTSDLAGSWDYGSIKQEYVGSFIQNAECGPIYAKKNAGAMQRFSGLNSTPTALTASFEYPAAGLAVSGDSIVVVSTNKISYSLDGGQTTAGTTSLGSSYYSGAQNKVEYNGSILAAVLETSSERYIAVTAALDTTPVIMQTSYNITGFGINGNIVAGIVDTSSDEQIKILKRDFSYSAKRIPRITPDGRSYAYIKALEE